MTTVDVWPDTVQVKLDGTGAGTARLGPTGHAQNWTVSSVSVRTAQAVSTGVCQCTMYAGDSPTSDNFKDATVSGDTGDIFDTAISLRLGQYIFAVWSGGVANDLATLTITGTSEQG